MDAALSHPATTGDSQAHSPPQNVLSARDARAIGVAALLLGIAADAFFRDGPLGAAFPLWIAALVLNLRSLVCRAGLDVTREAAFWLGSALLFALGIAWRNSDELVGLDLLATAGSLGMAAVALARPRAGLLAPRLSDTVVAFTHVIVSVAGGTVLLVLRDLHLEQARSRIGVRATPLLRSAAIAAAVLLVFGSLLRSADPIFASFVALPEIDLGVVMSHVLLIGFFTWITAGWARASLAPANDSAPRDRRTFRVAPRDAMTAIGTLDLLFAAFVLAQLGWMFGGAAYLRGRTGLTAAEYARRGFFEMVWVVALTVPIVVATRAMLPSDRAVRRRHTAFALPLVALLGAIIVSATFRLKLYVHYYGLTTDRLYALVLMGWLAIVVVWLVVTVLRDYGRPFVAGAVLSGLGILATLNSMDPDRVVARVNVARAASADSSTSNAPAVDLRHLARLRGGAVPIAVSEVLGPSRAPTGSAARSADDAQRCDAASELLQRWGPDSHLAQRRAAKSAWRRWNADDAAAVGAVLARAGELRAVALESCQHQAMPPS